MVNELSKSEKKLARELINKGLQQEYKKAIVELSHVIDDWKKEKLDNRNAYIELYKKLNEHDKNIARRYDDMKGSKYLTTVAFLLADGLITKEDMAGFSEENQSYLNKYLAALKC